MVATTRLPIVLPGTIMGTHGGAFPSTLVLDTATATGHDAIPLEEAMAVAITMAHSIITGAIFITDDIEVMEVEEVIEVVDGNC